MEILLEILKLTIPGLLTFVAAWLVLKTYMENQQQLEQLKISRDLQQASLPMKMQAYECLSLFCERIALPGLLLRTRREGMSAKALRAALMLSVQQEYEHNITQQVYVSAQLWEIIKIARDESVNIISLVAEKAGPEATGQQLAAMIFKVLEQQESLAVDKALLAIKKEAASKF